MEEFLKRHMERFDSVILSHPVVDRHLTQLEAKTNVKKFYLAYGFLGAIVLWLMFGYGAALLCNCIGFLYPAYCSIKAVESRSKDDDTQWLIYWVVFAVFSVLEFFTNILVGWVPFYWLSKCVFLLWCMSPLKGSEKIYSTFVVPWFNANQSSVDRAVNEGKQRLKDFANSAIAAEGKKAD